MSAATAAFPGSGRRLTPGTPGHSQNRGNDRAGHRNPSPGQIQAPPWNKGKLIGAKPPLRPKHVRSIRTKLQIADRKRDLAILDLQERQGVGDRAPEAGVAKQALGPVVRLIRRFAIGNDGSRSQSAARLRCPWEVRWLTVAKALSGASGRLRGSYGAPGREGDKASAVVTLWVAGRRSGRGRCLAAPGPAFVPPAAATA